ncbi:MAG: DUF1415 domain-containing protein [Pseudomonadota bacterium]|nr:DUF1415 domain-containing protein [Pseudomonadota bacterium]
MSSPLNGEDAARHANTAALDETRAWVERVVVGLRLCPFARAPQAQGRVRYTISEARDTEALLDDLGLELRRLQKTSPETIETTLLVHPHVLARFADYNRFLAIADELLRAFELEGTIQIASFHPRYRFAGSAANDLANATNQSPFPTLHLLREASIERALASFSEPESIYEANIRTMTRLGPAGWAALQKACRNDAAASAGKPILTTRRGGASRSHGDPGMG